MNALNRREWLRIGAAGLGVAALPVDSSATTTQQVPKCSLHFDGVLGTSLDIWLCGTADESTAEIMALKALDSIRRTFSLHDPHSELSSLNAGTEPVRVSADLAHVLRLSQQWHRDTDGAANPQVEHLARLWRDAERLGHEPDSTVLIEAVQTVADIGWDMATDGTVTRSATATPLNLNSLAKGLALDRVAEAIRNALPMATAGMINLGGDLQAWGDAWPVGVQNPLTPADNTPPLGVLSLTNASVATSGGYLRTFNIDGQRHSHLIDPRTGRPADGILSATVVATDSVTANALATALCILDPVEGLALAARFGAEALIVAADGGHHGTLVLLQAAPKAEDKPKTVDPPKPAANPWPEKYEVKVALELPKIEQNRYRRPYVAVWIEDANGKAVRTLTVWGNNRKWLRDLSDWWKFAKDNADLVKAVTRATRAPGKYDLVWDGKDDKGVAVGQGTYEVKVEVHREHGKHLRQAGKIECKAAPAKTKLEKNDETGETLVEFAKKAS